MTQVRIQGLTRQFLGSQRAAVAGLDLEVSAGEVVCLVGPSGCGKSTTLRLVAGLDAPDDGRIEIAGRDVKGVPPRERDVAMVFQGFALYPHMKVREILEFPLRMRGTSSAERKRAIEAAAELLGITRLLERRPAELSGGEQQRVAMGRAIVRKPQVFLFDEPLSNLDAALRASLRVELAKLLRELGATALYVTHDQVEAMTLGHRIAVLKAGKIEQIETPRHIYERPASVFVASFFGNPGMNLLHVERHGSQARAGSLELPAPVHAANELVLGVRPEHLRIVRPGQASPSPAVTECRFGARVTALEPLGAETHLELDSAGQSVRVRVAGFDAPPLGAEVELAFEPGAAHWFDRSTGLAL